MAAERGEKEIQTDWPVTKGLSGGITSQTGNKETLEPQGRLGQKMLVEDIWLEGLE